jgi:ubiquinone/menaquinone biosynthesis C-methylase UbiE
LLGAPIPDRKEIASEIVKSVHDWRSYTEIADHYDRVWSARFEAVARHIWARVPLNSADQLLDIGTGTGVVLRIRPEVAGGAGLMAGCDRSSAMLERARSNVAGLRVLVADATAMPLRDESFNVITSSFVLSHIQNYPIALAEMRRILKPGGTVAVSSWAPPSDPYSAAWNQRLAGAISKSAVEQAWAEVIPWEEHFSKRGALEEALTTADFLRADSIAVDVESNFTVSQFIEDREMSLSGRFGLHLLGPEGWERFRSDVARELHSHFGPSFHYCRGAFIATARKL